MYNVSLNLGFQYVVLVKNQTRLMIEKRDQNKGVSCSTLHLFVNHDEKYLYLYLINHILDNVTKKKNMEMEEDKQYSFFIFIFSIANYIH